MKPTKRQIAIVEHFVNKETKRLMKETAIVDSAKPNGKPIGGQLSIELYEKDGQKYILLTSDILAYKNVFLDKNGINDLILKLKKMSKDL